MRDLIKSYSREENHEAVDLLRLINYTNESVFLTGKAGTGKSYLLTALTKNTSKNYVILAPTGIAALHVNGQTIHSFFKFETRPYLPNDNGVEFLPKQNAIIKKLDLIIIDEVSMVRCDLMNAVDISLRRNTGVDLPFGGKQLLLIGDLFQLPPVLNSKNYKEVEVVNANYKTLYFFSAKPFEMNFKFHIVELEKVYRQKDAEFISLLNNVRENKVEQKHLIYLNNRFIEDYLPAKGELEIILATTNEIVKNTNSEKLLEIEGQVFEYNAIATGVFLNERSESKIPADRCLVLKNNAQVMFIKNDLDKRWVNGSLGKVISIDKASVNVRIDKTNTVHSVDRAVWENCEYIWNKEEERIEKIITGTFEQLPLKLAWAVTIHKSQGQSFDKVIIDLGRGAFATGQTYVALSRCRSFEGITLKTRVRSSDIKVDSKIQDFFANRLNEEMERQKFDSIINGLQQALDKIEPANEALRLRVRELESKNKSLDRNISSLMSLLEDENARIKRNNIEILTLKSKYASEIKMKEEALLLSKKHSEASARNKVYLIISFVALVCAMIKIFL